MSDARIVGKHMQAGPVADGWLIWNKRGTQILGSVAARGRWELPEFRPSSGAEFSAACLQALVHFMEALKP